MVGGLFSKNCSYRCYKQQSKTNGAFDYSSISKIASISTATFSGSEFVPTALRACFPFSPNTSIIKSEQPLTTAGCWEYPSMQLTSPKSFTKLTLSILSPKWCFNVASKFKPQYLAALFKNIRVSKI